MYVSAEIRWFWNEPPADLNTWFCDTTIHDCAVGGGAAREDAYFTDPQTELGIKRRGDGDVEIKGLVDVRNERVEPFVGPIEIGASGGRSCSPERPFDLGHQAAPGTPIRYKRSDGAGNCSRCGRASDRWPASQRGL